MDLHLFWFFTLGVLLTGYAVLDGFDLGVGMLHPIAKGDTERRLVMNSIGPLWDGNEVWLVTFGGALFAAFPRAYATAFSGFYLPFMLLLFAIIFRAVSLEFRSKVKSTRWRATWDWAFFGASFTASLLFGVAIGNAMVGMPIDEYGRYAGTTMDLLGVYPLLVGALTVALFAMHGALYLNLKTEGDLQARLKPWLWRTFGGFLVLYVLATIFTLVKVPHAVQHFESAPWLWALVVLNVLAIANIPRAIHQDRPLYAFVSSSCTIAALVVLFGAALFPNLLVSTLNPEWSLTIYNAASSEETLSLMRWIALLGMPFVLTYTGIVYWVFRGKVKLGSESY
ncbi:MAG: cytochrome d ubiquinol oxidase subunit II [Bradymonadia bacterium]